MIVQSKLIVVATELSNICEDFCTAYHSEGQNYDHKYQQNGKKVAKNGCYLYIYRNPNNTAACQQ